MVLKLVIVVALGIWLWRAIICYKTETSVFTKTYMYACLFGLLEAFLITFVGCAVLGAFRFLLGW